MAVLNAVLKLTDSEFKKGMSKNTQRVFKFADSVTTLTASMGALVGITANSIDETTKMSRQVGTSVEDFTSLKGAIEKSGLSMDDTKAVLTKFSFQTDLQRKAMENLGVEFENLDGSSTTVKEKLHDLADGISQIKDPAEKTRVAMELFGEQGTKAISLLSGGSQYLREMEEKARSMGQVFTEEAGSSVETFNDSFKDLKDSIGGGLGQFTIAIAEFTNSTGVIDGITSSISFVVRIFRDMPTPIKASIGVMGGLIAVVGTLTGAFFLLQATVLPAILAMTTAITPFLPLIALVSIAVGTLTSAFLKAKKNTEGFSNIVQNFGKVLYNWALIPVNIVINSVQGFIKSLGFLGTAMGHLVKGRFSEMKNSLGDVRSSFKGAFSSNVISDLELVRNKVSEVKTELDDFTTSTNQTSASVEESLQTQADKFSNQMSKIQSVASSFTNLGNSINSIFTQMSSNVDRDLTLTINKTLKTYTERDKIIRESYKKQIEDAKTAGKDTTEIEQKFSEEIEKLNEEKAKKVQELEKRKAMKKYEIDKKAFHFKKAIDIQDTVLKGISSAAQAFAQAIATPQSVFSFGSAGLVLGSILAGIIGANTAVQVGLLSAKKPPPPPQFAQGGVLSGRSHVSGGIPIEVEGGETIISKSRTKEFFEKFDGVSGGGVNITVNGNIYGNSTEEIADSVYSVFEERLAGG